MQTHREKNHEPPAGILPTGRFCLDDAASNPRGTVLRSRYVLLTRQQESRIEKKITVQSTRICFLIEMSR